MTDRQANSARSNETQREGHTGPIDFSELERPAEAIAPLPLPTHIKGYRILSVLGRGGMGVVYRAEQANPKREVALKVIGASFVSEQLLRRFELEAHTLGRLKHAGIAQIYEAGTADGGHGPQPFIAMELVEGEPIDEYAAKRSLGLPTKFQLLTKLCDAVQYAHQQGVIHRDLKPGNILITSEGQPKILDFGIARATDADVKSATLQTSVGQLVGTLPYMSPEQASGNPDEIDTRSDVYALGVVAFELLSGKLPIETRGMTIIEAARRIRETEATRLSSVDRALRGEVETIVQKAMEKDKTRRYETANALAADMKRYLNYEPISARPPSAWYQLRKFARRNKALVAGATMTVAALIAGTIVSTTLYFRAQRQSEIATAVSAFLTKRVLERATPAALPDKQVRDAIVKAMLEPAGESVAKDFAGKPLTEAAVRESLVASYIALGEAKLALPHAQAALETVQRAFGDDNPETLGAFINLGAVYRELGKFDEAESAFRTAVTGGRRVLGNDHPSTIKAIGSLGAVLADQGKFDEAEPLSRESLQRLRRDFGDDHPDTLIAMGGLRALLQARGKYAEAEPLAREVLDRNRRAHGSDHPDTMRALNNMGALYANEGKIADAEPYFREVVDRSRRIMGDDHGDTITAISNLAFVLFAQNKLADAEPLWREALERFRRTLGEDHPSTLTAMSNLGRLLEMQGKLDEAEAIYRDALQRSRRVLGDDNPSTITTMNNAAKVYLAQNRLDLAEPLYREAANRAKSSLGPQHPHTLKIATAFAVCLDKLNRPDEAAKVREEFNVPQSSTSPATAPATQPVK
ncbi:hypothetical protein BH09PLA1_BH09PLA1_03270 [soil metagenome]